MKRGRRRSPSARRTCRSSRAGSHTFNEVFGITRNPYDLSPTAGGVAAARPRRSPPACTRSPTATTWAARCEPAGRVLQRHRPSAVRRAGSGLSAATTVRRTLGVQGRWPAPSTTSPLLLSVHGRPRPALADLPGGARLVVRRSPSTATWPACGSPSRRDLDGAVQVDAECARRCSDPAAGSSRRSAAIVEEACPDFTGADECFRTLRAWQFEATLGAAQDRAARPVRSRQPRVATSTRDAGSPAPASGRAAVLQTGCSTGSASSSSSYDVLLLPVTQVSPFPVEQEYPAEIAGVPQTVLPGLDALRVLRLHHRRPGLVRTGRLHRRGPPGRPPTRRPPPRRPGRAPGRPHLRAGNQRLALRPTL